MKTGLKFVIFLSLFVIASVCLQIGVVHHLTKLAQMRFFGQELPTLLCPNKSQIIQIRPEHSRPEGGIDQGLIKLSQERPQHYFLTSEWGRLVKNVDCKALIRGDTDEQNRILTILKTEILTSKQGSDYINLTKNCERFKSSSGYITLPVNVAEQNFPLAFGIIMYKDIEQMERLLRSIYRPQNVYCIHIDSKSNADIKDGLSAIADCFDNVYIVPNPSDVKWGTYTVLEPHLKCMRLLWHKKKWKYYINLTGQEFPLKTNLEMVRILQVFNGANEIAAAKIPYVRRWKKYLPAPHEIVPSMGMLHITASRGYVDYLLHNQTAQDFLEWVKQTQTPDETYFSTMNHNPHLGVPGSYNGDLKTKETLSPYLSRYVTWVGGEPKRDCYGKYARSVCVYGIKDLPTLTSIPHFYVNKLYWDYQHYTHSCMEEWLFNKTRDELIHPSSLNITYYKELPFLKFIIPSGNLTAN